MKPYIKPNMTTIKNKT